MQTVTYKDKWLCSVALAVRACHPRVIQISPCDLCRVAGQSTELCKALLAITLLRGHNISGELAKPGFERWPSEEEFEKTSDGRRTKAIAREMLLHWHVDADAFDSPRHFCDGQTCSCSPSADSVYQLTTCLLAALMFLMPSRAPELGRWTTTSAALSCTVLSTLFGRLGPAGWLHAWPKSVADRLLLQNETNDNHYARENSVRIAGVSTFFSDDAQQILCCLLCAVLLPIDWYSSERSSPTVRLTVHERCPCEVHPGRRHFLLVFLVISGSAECCGFWSRFGGRFVFVLQLARCADVTVTATET
jgi:hypothetical protein